MKKYRVVEKDGEFSIQKRFLFFFWVKRNVFPFKDVQQAIRVAQVWSADDARKALKENVVWAQ